MNTPEQGRRGFLRSACRHCLGFGALAGLPSIAQDLSAIKVPPRFSRPAADTDEGGLRAGWRGSP